MSKKENGETTMKMTTAKKMILGSFAACLALGAMADAPAISDVVARQRWPWSRLVDIDYVLTCDPTVSVDVHVTAQDGTVPLDLPFASLSGHMYNVTPGPRRIIFDPTKTAYTNNQMLTQFSVTLTPTPAPLYMIVDLTKNAGADGQIQYVYESDLTNGLWGAWVRNPVTNRGTVVESVVWTGVTTNDIYKTDKLVLRRVPAGSYTMGGDGDTQRNVTLTKGMYAGVFQVTQRQWSHITGDVMISADTYPKYGVSYFKTREDPTGEAGADDPAVDWPSNRTVNADSFMGKLRARTGIADFDLPTEAQWEYLCRAKTTTVFNDGNADAKYDGELADNNGNTNQYLNALGWYKFSTSGSPKIALVGLKLPNAWGLYDMHGNVFEWCLDWSGTIPGTDVEDPVGPSSGTLRIARGGAFDQVANLCRSSKRNSAGQDNKGTHRGLRVVRTLQ